MTNDTLSHVLRNINVSKGNIVRTVGNLEAILIKNHRTVKISANGNKYVNYYEYLILLKDGKKAGIILKCDNVDIHIYVYPKYRNQKIVSRLTGDGFLKKLWPDIDSISCKNLLEFYKIRHLAQIQGFTLRVQSEIEERLDRIPLE